MAKYSNKLKLKVLKHNIFQEFCFNIKIYLQK